VSPSALRAPLDETGVVHVDAELLNAVRTARRQLTAAGPSVARSQDDFEHVSIPVRDADVLRDLLIANGAHVVIEIGLAYGSSALAIAEALVSQGTTRASHVIVDAFQDHFYEAGWDAIVAAGLRPICSLLRERSQLALPQLITEGYSADAAFVDGSHVFHNVFVDLVYLRELVRPGGLIILDDCQWPSVETAARYFELNTGWRREPIAPETRLRAYRLPDPPVDPSFEDFKMFGPRGAG
jgi:predicted O-methyltransferase YrrM